MPDTDFTPALIEASDKRIQHIEDLNKIKAWLREPDYVETASLEWLTGWINRRPLAEFARVCTRQ